jgi:hypothetical protein
MGGNIMVKRLSLMLLFTVAYSFAQGIGGTAGIGGKTGVGGGPSCSPPSLTYQWAAYSLTGTNNCGSAGTSSCTNGASVYTLTESIAGNNAVQATSANQPLFETNQINGLPAIESNGLSGVSAEYLPFSMTIPDTANFTIYAMVKSSSLSGYQTIISNDANTSSIEYGIPNAAHQYVRVNGYSSGLGSATLSTGTWYTLALTFTYSTLAYNLYICSGGTCTSDGSGTAGGSPSQPINSLFGPNGDDSWNGYVAEWGYLNSVSTSGIAAYSLCKYGI